MRSPSQLKQDFLKKWAKGLQIYSCSKNEMTILEKKKAIKLSADVAMASTRSATTRWSRALIADASKNNKNKVVVEQILGHKCEKENKGSVQMVMCNKRERSKKILKKSYSVGRVRKMAPKKVGASSIAKRLVKKRTQVLKGLLPGGESMDKFSLIKEALDYIVSLRLQVDVMRRLASATGLLNCNNVVKN